jgi:hypothetical protein
MESSKLELGSMILLIICHPVPKRFNIRIIGKHAFKMAIDMSALLFNQTTGVKSMYLVKRQLFTIILHTGLPSGYSIRKQT